MNPSHCPSCGHVFATKPRSQADHRRFFAGIQRAYEHFPEAHDDFTPLSAEHLRAWLLVKAGWFDVQSIPVEQEIAASKELMALVRLGVEAALAAVAARGDFAFLRVSGAGFEILSAKSISYQACDQKAFAPVREKAEEIACGIIGVESFDALIKESDRAA